MALIPKAYNRHVVGYRMGLSTLVKFGVYRTMYVKDRISFCFMANHSQWKPRHDHSVAPKQKLLIIFHHKGLREYKPNLADYLLGLGHSSKRIFFVHLDMINMPIKFCNPISNGMLGLLC